MLRQKLQDFLSFQGPALLAHDEEQRSFLPFRVLHTNDGRCRHRRMSDGGIFQVDRADPFAARLDQIFDAIPDLHDALGIDGGDVAGGKPARHQR